MKKTIQVEKEMREFHKVWFSEYVAKVLEIEHRVYGNNACNSYNAVYSSCIDAIIYSEEEKEEIYEIVDSILTNKYKLLFAHNNLDESTYLVDISDKDVSKC